MPMRHIQRGSRQNTVPAWFLDYVFARKGLKHARCIGAQFLSSRCLTGFRQVQDPGVGETCSESVANWRLGTREGKIPQGSRLIRHPFNPVISHILCKLKRSRIAVKPVYCSKPIDTPRLSPGPAAIPRVALIGINSIGLAVFVEEEYLSTGAVGSYEFVRDKMNRGHSVGRQHLITGNSRIPQGYGEINDVIDCSERALGVRGSSERLHVSDLEKALRHGISGGGGQLREPFFFSSDGHSDQCPSKKHVSNRCETGKIRSVVEAPAPLERTLPPLRAFAGILTVRR